MSRRVSLYDLVKRSQDLGRINLLLDALVSMEDLVRQFCARKLIFSLIPFLFSPQGLINDINKVLRKKLLPEEAQGVGDLLLFSIRLVKFSSIAHRIYSYVTVVSLLILLIYFSKFPPVLYEFVDSTTKHLTFFSQLLRLESLDFSQAFLKILPWYAVIFFANLILYGITFICLNQAFDKFKELLLKAGAEVAESLIKSLRIVNQYRERREAQEQEGNLRKNLLTLAVGIAQFEFDIRSKFVLYEAEKWKNTCNKEGVEPDRLTKRVENQINTIASDRAFIKAKGEFKSGFIVDKTSQVAAAIEAIMRDLRLGSDTVIRSLKEEDERRKVIEYKYKRLAGVLALLRTYGSDAISEIELRDMIEVLSISDTYNVVNGDINMNQAGRDINQIDNSGNQGIINIAETIARVTSTINQLPNQTSPDQPDLKALLTQLISEIDADESLSKHDREDLIDATDKLAKSVEVKDETLKNQMVRRAKRVFDGIQQGLPETAKLAEACAKLLPLIMKALGFPT